MRTRHIILTLAVAVLCTASLRAHHGIASFANDKMVTVEGAVTAFEWTNPHGYLYVDAPDAQGKVVNWRIEFGSIGNMRLRGLARTTFKAGDKVRVTGVPRIDGFPEMLFRRAFAANGQEITPPPAPPQGGQPPSGNR